jgi:hypothetical protein
MLSNGTAVKQRTRFCPANASRPPSERKFHNLTRSCGDLWHPSSRITEQFKLRFERTFTNLPNDVNFGTPNMNANSSAFSVISSASASKITSYRTERSRM